MLSASHGPKGFKIRVERYSRSLSNTAGGAKTVKEPRFGALKLELSSFAEYRVNALGQASQAGTQIN